MENTYNSVDSVFLTLLAFATQLHKNKHEKLLWNPFIIGVQRQCGNVGVVCSILHSCLRLHQASALVPGLESWWRGEEGGSGQRMHHQAEADINLWSSPSHSHSWLREGVALEKVCRIVSQ